MATKDKVLEILENNRGKSFSGENIAKKIMVSRNAVWKTINELKKEGYNITASTNKGYCLAENNDIISAQSISPFLQDSSLSKKILVFDCLESTNKTAKELAINNSEHGTVIIANKQTAGKGRYGRQFFSPENGGLYISFILHPEQLCFENTTIITSFAALSVCKAIEDLTDKKPKIKWVNDIFLDNKKICGILTEAITDFESGNLQWLVLGIGINVTTPQNSFSPELSSTATSIFPDGNASITRSKLAAKIIDEILSSNKSITQKEVFLQYKQRLLGLNQLVNVSNGKDTYSATAIDIDEFGHLVVQKQNGETATLSSGEIRIKL